MKLGTHAERLSAIESAYDSTEVIMEKASLIDLAARLERENFYHQRDAAYAQSQSGQTISGGIIHRA